MDEDLYRHFHFTVDPGQEPLRIDVFLLHKIENATRTRIQYALEAGNILVNGKTSKSNYKVRPGDDIQIVFPYPKREIELIPEDIPIKIMYEDDDIIVIDKEPGMVVHPAAGNFTGTLMNAVVHHIRMKNEELKMKNEKGNSSLLALSSSPHNIRPGLVHRIDKNTSGLLVIAKNELAMTRLAKEFYEKTIQRKYIALVWGDFPTEMKNEYLRMKNESTNSSFFIFHSSLDEIEGTATAHIGRDHKDRKKMAAYPSGAHGKPAVTHFKVLERLRYVTLLECKLETGRTHQIRVHMQYIKHPVFNDEVYGGNRILRGMATSKYTAFVENCFTICPRQALHAMSLGFTHPTTGKPIYFESPLPDDMKQLIEKWRGYTKRT